LRSSAIPLGKPCSCCTARRDRFLARDRVEFSFTGLEFVLLVIIGLAIQDQNA
jgi:hypothetical protein